MKKQDRLMYIMWKYLKKYRKSLVLAMALSVLTGICVAVQPLVIKYIVDGCITNEAMADATKIKYVGILCVVYVILSFIRPVSFNKGREFMYRDVGNALVDLRSQVFDHVGHMGLRFHAEVSTGELHNCLNGTPISNISNYLYTLVISVPYQLVSLVISLYALVQYDWAMTLVMLLAALLMAVLNYFARRKIAKLSAEQVAVEARANRQLVDTLRGIEAVKIYSVEESIKRRYDQTLRSVRDSGLKVFNVNHREASKLEIVQNVGVAVVYLVGAISCVYRDLTVGVLYAFLSSMTTILGTLSSWMTLGMTKSSAQSGMDAIMRIARKEIDVPNIPSAFAKSVETAYEETVRKQSPCAEFSNVCFAYQDNNIFEHFDCQLRSGESIALVGESGSGKSTFTKLLLRLYDVSGGSVRVFGNDVKDYSVHDLRSSFGVVPQSTTIFYGTIWDNIKIAAPEATDEEILRAIKMAHMDDFKDSLEKGWDTVVGDGARDLSGGQKQRIGIARAVLGNPKILIFDEATSALDNISEKAVQNAMESLMKDHTVIVVAHRLSTIRNVDRILVFKSGRIVEEGTYDELARKENGLFRQMLAEQGDKDH